MPGFIIADRFEKLLTAFFKALLFNYICHITFEDRVEDLWKILLFQHVNTVRPVLIW
jgi:hypothetical protein